MASVRMLREAHTHSFHSVLLVLWRFIDAQQEWLLKVKDVHGAVYELLITIIIPDCFPVAHKPTQVNANIRAEEEAIAFLSSIWFWDFEPETLCVFILTI